MRSYWELATTNTIFPFYFSLLLHLLVVLTKPDIIVLTWYWLGTNIYTCIEYIALSFIPFRNLITSYLYPSAGTWIIKQRCKITKRRPPECHSEASYQKDQNVPFFDLCSKTNMSKTYLKCLNCRKQVIIANEQLYSNNQIVNRKMILCWLHKRSNAEKNDDWTTQSIGRKKLHVSFIPLQVTIELVACLLQVVSFLRQPLQFKIMSWTLSIHHHLTRLRTTNNRLVRHEDKRTLHFASFPYFEWLTKEIANTLRTPFVKKKHWSLFLNASKPKTW